MKTTLRALSVVAALLTAAGAAHPQEAPGLPPLTLAQALELAAAANPGLAATRLGTDVARAGIAVARQRPNPELLLEEVLETPKDAATISQTLELGGKRQRRIDLATAGVESRSAEVARAVADLRNRVRRGFFALDAAERRLTETEALRALAQRTSDAAGARFQSGAAPRLDTLQAELALAQAENEAQTAEGLRSTARSQLNVLLARPADAPTRTTGTDEPAEPPAEAVAIEIALKESTELAVLDRAIAEQKARVALAVAEKTPSPTLQGGITHRGQPEFDWGWRAGLNIPLPIFTFRGAAVELERQTLTQLEAERRARTTEIAGAVQAASTAVAAERAQLRRFRDKVLPQAEEVERMAEDSYRSGQTGLPALLQALQATRDIRLRAIQAGADYQAALADLESAMGVALP